MLSLGIVGGRNEVDTYRPHVCCHPFAEPDVAVGGGGRRQMTWGSLDRTVPFSVVLVILESGAAGYARWMFYTP